MESINIDPTEGFFRDYANLIQRVKSLETRPAGEIVIRDSITTSDPNTGVDTVFGKLPDGTVGVQPWINDIIPPNKPSTPKLATDVGIYSVSWDGLDYLQLPQPKDYARTGVQISADGLTNWVEIDVLRGKGVSTVVDQPYAVVRHFRLIAYDENNNASEPSNIVSLMNTSDFDDSEFQERMEEVETKAAAAEAVAVEAQGVAGTAQDTADQAKLDALAASGIANTKGKTLFSTTAPAVADQNLLNLWIDTTNGENTPKRWNGSTWISVTDKTATDAADAAAAANALIITKTTTYYGASATGTTAGDLWIDTTLVGGVAGNVLKRWSGSAWVVVTDKKLQEALTKAGDAQATADGKIRTFSQTTQPTGMVATDIGDLWVDTDDGNNLWRWSGTAWVDIQDTAISSAAALASTANQTAIDANAAALAASGLAASKGKIIYSTSAPTGADANINTLWIDSTGNANTPKKWVSGTTWAAITDKVAIDAATLAAAANAAVITKTTTFYGTSATGTTAGDLWIDTTLVGGVAGNVLKRWSGSAWVVVTDKKLQEALTAAGDAKSIADGKIRTFAQTTAPTGMVATDVGDIWVDTDDGNKLWRWSGTAWVVVQDTSIAAAASLAGTANQAAIDANAAAQAASGLAGTKGKVLVQSTAPGIEDRNASTLWIDTTGGANTPKRWVSGTTWAAVTDKVAIDAAAAVIVAQAKADQAFNTATTAATNAGNAQTAADSKARVWYQTTAPTGTGHKNNDIWFKQPENTVNRWNTATNAWISIQDTAIGTAASDITALQTSVSGKNKIVNSTANASGTTGYVAGDRWQKWSTLATGGKLLASWRFTTSWIAESIDPVYIPQIDIGAGTFGDLNGSRMAVKSIQAESLVVGDYTNLMPNGTGDLGAGIGWGASLIYDTSDTPPNVIGAFKSTAGQSTYSSSQAVYFSVEPDTDYSFEIWLKSDKPGSNIFVELRDQNGGLTTVCSQLQDLPYSGSGGYAVANYTVPTVWSKLYANIHTSTTTSKLRAGNIYFNHSSSVDKTATISVAGFLVKRQIPGSLIVKGSITAESGIIGSFDLGKGTVGELDGIRIKAKSLFADKLVISAGGNLFPDPEVKDTSGGWTGANITYQGEGTGMTLGGSILIAATGSQTGAYYGLNDNGRTMPVVPGATYRVTAWFRAGVVVPAGYYFSLYARVYKSDGTVSSATPTLQANSDGAAANTWTKALGVFTMPDDAARFTIGVYAQSTLNAAVRVSDIAVQQAASGELIVDGAIDGKVITGATIQTTTATNRGILLNKNYLRAWNSSGVQTFDLSATTGNITAVGGTITGAVVQTTASANRGILMNSSYLRAWNSSGVQMFNLDANTGAITAANVSLSGTVRSSGVTGAGVNITAVMGGSVIEDVMYGTSVGVVGYGFEYTGTGSISGAGMTFNGSSMTNQSLLLASGPYSEGGGSYLRLNQSGASLFQVRQGLHIAADNGLTIQGYAGPIDLRGSVYINGEPIYAQQPWGSPTALEGASNDLNGKTSPGLYNQNSNANAVSGLNYPTPLAGMLEVMSNGSSMIYQRYTVYNSGVMWTRTKYGGTWYSWSEVAQETGWTKLGLQFGWSEYAGGGGYKNGVWCRRFGDSVQITGMIRAGAVNSNIAQIPYSMQPVSTHLVPAVSAAVFGAVVYDSTTGFLRYAVGPAAPSYLSFSISLPIS